MVLTNSEWGYIKQYLPHDTKTGKARANDKKVITTVVNTPINGCGWKDTSEKYEEYVNALREWGRTPVWKGINLLREIRSANERFYRQYKVEQAIEIIEQANKIFKDKLAVGFSGGKDSLVILELALKVNPDITIVFNNTTVEFPESVRYTRWLAKEWGLNLQITRPKKSFLTAVKEYGWATYENRWCCTPYKKEPTFEFFDEQGIKAEITGTSRTESRYRMHLTPFKVFKDGLIRVNPLYDWNYEEVWAYIRYNNLPYNPLYDLGFKRVGCWCCPLKGITHYRKLQHTHTKMYSFLSRFEPLHPRLTQLEKGEVQNLVIS
jgi:phosphoadenylyl-sulfate reductase (thioredoxin)